MSTLRERVFQVFGSEALEELIELGSLETALESRAFTLNGFISRPQIQKSNRNSIFLFVNRRLIRDRLLLHAISAAYHNLMPPACYPFALLFLDCDPAEVDVNVHPSKTEVRFRHAGFVHDFVRDSLRRVLIDQRPAPSAPPGFAAPPPAQPAARLPYSEFTQTIENMRFDEVREPRSVLADFPAPQQPEPTPEYVLRREPGPHPRFDFAGQPIELEAPPAGAIEPLRLPVPDTHGGFPAGIQPDPTASMSAVGDLRVLGQLHESFIVAAARDGLWIIDQHVAHERILFEKVLAQQAAGRVEQQRLLMPIVVQLTPAQQVEYERIADDLLASGFETEPFGHRTIAVKAVPSDLAPGAVERVLYEILEVAEHELRKVSVGDLRRGIAASIACRAAIKINTPLDAQKMSWLLRELARTDCPMSCPHGRPVALRYSNRDILRSFHRI